MKLPFNRPFLTGRESEYLRQVVESRQLAGNGPFTKRCHELLERHLPDAKVLLTHSATAALEMAALLLDLEPGDEVVLPSFTFVSTANAFALRRAVPVFVDVHEETLNIDEAKIEAALSPRSRAIVAVHYAGVSCQMSAIRDIARRHDLAVIEDAAQALGSSYEGQPLGTLGELSAFSFHETKNIVSGEGGALIVNEADFAERAEVLWEKGTDRCRFYRGEIDKYTWQDLGSSFLPSELIAAFLYAQLEEVHAINEARVRVWRDYHEALAPLERDGLLRRPRIPSNCRANGHLYYVLLEGKADRARVMAQLQEDGISTVFHYAPLHCSPAGRRFGRVAGTLEVTEAVAPRLVRLPLWVGMDAKAVDFVAERLAAALRSV